MWINKPPFPICVFDDVNTPISYINTMDIDDVLPVVSTFIINQHTEPFDIINSKYQCYLNSVIQLLFTILRTIGHTFLFNFSMEGSLSTCLIDTAHSVSSSKDVDAFKFRLAKSDTFYNGQIHQDSSECLTMLIEVINKGPMPYFGSNDNSTCVSLCGILFLFFVEK